MMHKSLFTVLGFMAMLFTSPCASASSVTDSLLHVYDTEVAQAEHYFGLRQAQIDSLQQLPHSPEHLLQIAELFQPYQCDSALAYYSLALEAEEPYKNLAKIRLVYLLASIGYYSEGMQMAQQIGRTPAEQRLEYYSAMNRLYGESAVYGKVEPFKQQGFQRAAQYQDSLMQTLVEANEPSVMLHKFRLIQARNLKQYDLAILESDSALQLTPEYSHEYAIIAYETAIIYRSMGQEELYMEWLVKSAISDVRCGITDNGSSWMLAQIMFDDGEVDRAYHYIDYSLSNAGRFNARLRYVQINPLGLIINQAYQAQQSKMSRRLKIALLFLLVALLGLALVVVYTIRQNRRLNSLYEKQGLMNAELNTLNAQLKHLNSDLSTLNSSLQEVNHVKEQYICRYLEVYSEYIRRLTQMARKAGVKDPDAFQSKEMADFYRSFDSTFLSIYHSFVSDFNALLREDERIVPKQGELLTTELRIFALIRLGINSSAKIAELLCYSPNTIYNYRARVKNGALGDREQFEERVRTIGTIHMPASK